MKLKFNLKIFLLFNLFILCGLMFCSCISVKNESVESPVIMPEKFSSNGKEILSDKWWHSFEDPKLNKLIEEALDDNFSIKSSWDRLRQAEQIAKKSGSNLFPSSNYQSSATRARSVNNDNTSYSTDFLLGLVTSYEIDLWGKIRASRKADLLDVEISKENLHTAGITLSSNIAKTWYRLAEAYKQNYIISNQIETNEKFLELVKTQFKKGLVGISDVLRQQQLLESSSANLCR